MEVSEGAAEAGPGQAGPIPTGPQIRDAADAADSPPRSRRLPSLFAFLLFLPFLRLFWVFVGGWGVGAGGCLSVRPPPRCQWLRAHKPLFAVKSINIYVRRVNAAISISFM